MTTKRESEIEREVKRRFPAALALKTHVRHWPDTVFFLPNGNVILMEFKRPKESLRQGQASMIGRLRSMGFAVYTVDNAERGLEILQAELTRLP